MNWWQFIEGIAGALFLFVVNPQITVPIVVICVVGSVWSWASGYKPGSWPKIKPPPE